MAEKPSIAAETNKRHFFEVGMMKRLAVLVYLLICGTPVWAEEDDPYGTDAIFELNLIDAAQSELSCKTIKLSKELKAASAKMMQAEILARGEEGSTLEYSADVFEKKKNIELEIRSHSRNPAPGCVEIKARCLRQLTKTKKKTAELLNIAAAKLASEEESCPLSADHYLDTHLRYLRVSDLACYKRAAARELR